MRHVGPFECNRLALQAKESRMHSAVQLRVYSRNSRYKLHLCLSQRTACCWTNSLTSVQKSTWSTHCLSVLPSWWLSSDRNYLYTNRLIICYLRPHFLHLMHKIQFLPLLLFALQLFIHTFKKKKSKHKMWGAKQLVIKHKLSCYACLQKKSKKKNSLKTCFIFSMFIKWEDFSSVFLLHCLLSGSARVLLHYVIYSFLQNIWAILRVKRTKF